MSSVIQISEVHYPESDGKPMGETDEHREEMVRHIELLQHHFEGQQVYVSGNLLVYYEQGNPRKFVVPDAFVVKGIAPGKRRIYKIWVEHKVPDVIIETTSRKTRRKDTAEKPALYAGLGVKEYFLFDCLGEYLDPPLQGQRLTGGTYQAIPGDETGAVVSDQLGLKLRVEANKLQFYRLGTGERLLVAAERAERESQRAQEASQRAQEASQRADKESRRAEREAQIRRAAEAEVARLREELARRSGP